MPHTNADHHPRLPSFSIQGATFIVMVGSMFLFETLQMIFFPQMTDWRAGVATVLFSSTTAMIYAFIFWQRMMRRYAAASAEEARNHEDQIKDQRDFYQFVLDTDPSLIYVKDQQGRYLLGNQALAGFLGTTPQGLAGKSDEDFNLDRHCRDEIRQHEKTLLALEQDRLITEENLVDPEGRPHWYATTLRKRIIHDGDTVQIVGVSTDICKLKMYENRLVYERLHDPLTGLPNLESLKAYIEKRNQLEVKPDTLFAFMLLDIDHFKRVNESLGYSLGDQFMVAISKRLESCVRSSDLITRLKGDEFAILLQDLTDAEEVNPILKRINEKLHLPFVIHENEINISISIGIVFGNGVAKSFESLLQDAEIAVNQAKRQGKSHCVVFDDRLRLTHTGRMQLENDLRKAIGKQLKLYYQPIISLENGKVVAVEALVRWQHPKRGLIYPVEFIGLAEESDLIISLGEWVLREACTQARRWQDQFAGARPLTVSVNISSKQLLFEGFIDQVCAILEETGLDAQHLKMEITESVYLGKSERVVGVLSRLNELGVRLYIDDFGTGYSSLSYLSHIPFDAIKIDRSFIEGIINRDGDMKIVEAIVRLARDLGKELVAEGVETTEQRDWLQRLGCGYEQGYLFSRPVEPGEIEKIFQPQYFDEISVTPAQQS